MPRSTPQLSRALSRLVRGLALLLILVPTLLTLAQQVPGAESGWLELTRYLPYPVMLAPGAVALLLSCALGWRWVLASVASLVLVATLAMGLAWGHPDGGALPLRVMTYNIKAYRAMLRSDGLAQIAQEVALHDPDVLVVQDFRGPTPPLDSALWPGGRAFGFAHAFTLGQYVVASRHPLRDCGLRDTADRGELRYVVCTVEVHGIAVTLVTAHFDSPRSGLNAARHDGLEGADDWEQNHLNRLAQARALAADLQGARRPLIVAGDLNAPESSPVIRALLDTGLRDAFSSAGRGYGYTHGHSLRPHISFLRIDHILVSPGIGVTDSFAGNPDASEHRPVIANLLLSRD